jgi:hypothetical protein
VAQRAIRPDWLLRQADELGYRGAGQGQPRNTNLRRAVSSAYYAVFHAVATEVSDFLLPGGAPDERQRLGRSITHANLRNACEYILTPNRAPIECRPIAQTAAANIELVDFAEAVLSLQEARHRADYDHLADFTKVGTLQLVDEARAAVASLHSLRGTPDVQRFVSMLVLRPVLR